MGHDRCKERVSLDQAKSSVIAVPGLKTSAYLGLRLAWGDVQVDVVPFDEIIPRILDDTYTCGLIIHEGQLTYVEHDQNVDRFRVWWNERTDGWPMPLGGNVVRRDLGQQVMEDITMYTKMSIEHSIHIQRRRSNLQRLGVVVSMMKQIKNS